MRRSLLAALLVLAPAAFAQTLSFASASYNVSESWPAASLTVRRSGDLSQAQMARIELVDRSAKVGADYRLPATNTIRFAPGVSTVTFDVPLVDDTVFEDLEYFEVYVIPSPNQGSWAATAIEIRDDDPPVFLRLGATNYPAVESSGNATVTVVRSGNLDAAVSVSYGTSFYTASPGEDYTPTSGTLVFNPGETSRNITIPLLDDALSEGPETFVFYIFDAHGAVMNEPKEATVTIVDDEPLSTISLTREQDEVAEGAGTAIVTVTRSGAVDRRASVHYATGPATCFLGVCAPTDATDGVDYAGQEGTLTFAPGERSKTIAVPIFDDALGEAAEEFFFDLSQPSNAALGLARERILIVDDDGVVTIDFPNRSIRTIEGTDAVVEVRCNHLVAGSATIEVVAYADGIATAGADFVAIRQTLTFTPDNTTQRIVVPTIDDNLAEGTERFFVGWNAKSSNIFALGEIPATVFIDDNDGLTLSVSDATVVEGNAGTTEAVFEVSLSAPAVDLISVGARTVGNSATAGVDFEPLQQNVSFAPGETKKTFRVPIYGDTVPEENETFTVLLSTTLNDALLGKRIGVGIIKDDDPAFSVQDSGVTEGDDGTRNAIFTVRLSAPLTSEATVNYRTADGTALGGSDFEHVRGTLRFAPGETSKQIAVPVHGDTTAETDETFFVRIDDAHGAQITRGLAQGLIINDDAFYTLQSDVEYAPGMLLDLYVPTTGKPPYPVIIWTDGQTPSSPIRQTARGFAVAAIRMPAHIEDAKAAVRWLRANAARFALDDAHIIAWGRSLTALLGTSGGVASLEDLSQGNAAEPSAVQAAIVFGGPYEEAEQYRTPEDPPFFVIDQTAIDERALDGFLDSVVAPARRRSAGR